MKKILIVDDEEAFAKNVVKAYLESSGEYEVIVELSGVDAVQTAVKVRPDLIFLDVMMRDCGGPKIASAMSSIESLKDVPIVYVTATVTAENSGTNVIFDGTLNGRPYFAKPVKLESLLKCVKQYLD
jgi:CheY-like chemotaxis protein